MFSVVTCPHLPSHAVTCRHPPSPAVTCRHLPSPAFTCRHLPSLPVRPVTPSPRFLLLSARFSSSNPLPHKLCLTCSRYCDVLCTSWVHPTVPRRGVRRRGVRRRGVLRRHRSGTACAASGLYKFFYYGTNKHLNFQFLLVLI